jgi:hypothetical protein
LFALHVLLDLELFLAVLVVVVGIAIHARVLSGIRITIILTVVTVEVITLAIVVVTITVVGEICLAFIFTVYASNLEVSIYKGVQVYDVVSVSSLAATGLGRRTGCDGTETETHKTLGRNLDIGIVLGVCVPLWKRRSDQ